MLIYRDTISWIEPLFALKKGQGWRSSHDLDDAHKESDRPGLLWSGGPVSIKATLNIKAAEESRGMKGACNYCP
jgi:hypothetical protein